MTPSATSSAGPLSNGDLVLLDYELWSEGAQGAELIGASRATPSASGTPSEGASDGAREPRAHLVGGEFFPAGIENALLGAKLGEEIAREFPPAEAFGERDPKLIELFSMHEISRLPEMRREDAELNVGTVLTIHGRRGRVVTLTAARVRVDFNPPFAGRKVRARLTPIRRIEEPAEQVRALIDLTYGHGPSFEVKLHQGVVTVHLPDRTKFDFAWMAAKPRIIDRIRTHLKPKSIHLVEEYATPTEPAPAPKASEPADEASPPAKSGPSHAPG